jgi:hypothetical protein
MGYLDTDVKKNSESNAIIFVQKYIEYLLSLNGKQKQRFISDKKTEFLNKYSRIRVQELIDGDMATCNDELIAFEYLVAPESVLYRYYNNLIENDTKDLVNMFSSKVIACYKELSAKVGRIRE